MGRISRDARLVFILLWTLADDSGRMRGNSRMLGGLLLPYDEDSREVIPRCLDELEREGCIQRYNCKNGHEYIAITNWESHQKIDKRGKSKLPEPNPPNPREHSGGPAESSRTFGLGSKDLRIKDQGSKDQGSGDSKGEIAEPAGIVAIAKPLAGPNVSSVAVSSVPAKPPRSKAFEVPSIEDVEAYCRSRGNQVNAASFWNYYTANGWKVGRNAMKDWKAAVRTWEQKHSNSNTPETFREKDRRISNEAVVRVNLEQLGLSPEQAKRLASQYEETEAYSVAKQMLSSKHVGNLIDFEG